MLTTVYQDAMFSNLVPTRIVQRPKLGSFFVCVGWRDGGGLKVILTHFRGMVYSFSYKYL